MFLSIGASALQSNSFQMQSRRMIFLAQALGGELRLPFGTAVSNFKEPSGLKAFPKIFDHSHLTYIHARMGYVRKNHSRTKIFQGKLKLEIVTRHKDSPGRGSLQDHLSAMHLLSALFTVEALQRSTAIMDQCVQGPLLLFAHIFCWRTTSKSKVDAARWMICCRAARSIRGSSGGTSKA